jgi:hypothetical protein
MFDFFLLPLTVKVLKNLIVIRVEAECGLLKNNAQSSKLTLTV